MDIKTVDPLFDAMLDGVAFIDLKGFRGYADVLLAISNHLLTFHSESPEKIFHRSFMDEKN